MTAPHTVAVLGLGMIGGSVARGLAAAGATVAGFDVKSSYLDAAVAEGVVTHRLPRDLSTLASAEAVVIATNGDAAVELVSRIEPFARDLKLVTDVGSTKRTIVATAEQSGIREIFVGAHPFAGDHRSGWDASRFDLFERETVFVCPGPSAASESVVMAQALWTSLGARCVKMDAREHDELLAWTSHLPHIVSTAFALALADAGIVHRQLGRGGRDVSRLAASSPDLWTAIAIDNRDSLEPALAAVERRIGDFRAFLQSADRAAVNGAFAKGRDWSGPQER